jgi:hypothetical protein
MHTGEAAAALCLESTQNIIADQHNQLYILCAAAIGGERTRSMLQIHDRTCTHQLTPERRFCCTCTQAQELQQVLASISGAEQELQALQEQREQLQPAAREAAELRTTIAQLQDEVRPCLTATCALADSCSANWGGRLVSCNMVRPRYAAALIFLVESGCH